MSAQNMPQSPKAEGPSGSRLHSKNSLEEIVTSWKAAAVDSTTRLQTIVDDNFQPQPEPVKHDVTAVLLLHWENSDMDVSEEVNRVNFYLILQHNEVRSFSHALTREPSIS